jgi:hypothetical protein
MIGCDCNAGLSNTGRPNCVPVHGVTSSLILVPLFANDGTRNGIDLSAPLPSFSGLVNEADASKRWFPLPSFENVELPKADSLFEEANSGRMAFLRQGKRSFSGELWAEDSTPTFLGKLQKSRCVDFGIYIVDVNGNLIGAKESGYLYPIPVDNASWDPRFMFATDSTVQKIMLGFDFDRLFDESLMYMITVAEAGLDFTTLEGLKDVNILNAVGSEGSNTIVYELTLDYGTALNPIIVQGLSGSDFVYQNETTASTLLPLSVIEGPNGTYTATFANLDINLNDVVNIAIDKAGFIGNADVTIGA